MHLRATVVAWLATLLLAGVATPANAHTPDPGYRSLITGITPHTPGLSVQVLGYDNQLKIINQSRKTVQIDGYLGEPYVLMLPSGVVEVNQRSPATYSNQDRFAVTPIPKSADAKATPQWKVVDTHGQYIWHDHRMHWMSHTLPPAVHDKHQKTKVFDFHVPLKIGGQAGSINGVLFWVGIPKSSPVVWFVALGVLTLLGVAFVVWRRRQNAALDASDGGRGDDDDPGRGGGAGAAPTDELREAW